MADRLSRVMALLSVCVLALSCVTNPPPVVTPKPPEPVPPALVLSVSVFNGDALSNDKLVGTSIRWDGKQPGTGETDSAGNFWLPAREQDAFNVCAVGGQTAPPKSGSWPDEVCIGVDLSADRHVDLSLTYVAPLLPLAPSRDEILNLHLTFQGLTVQTAQFGELPWFEAALPWLNPSDRQATYAAKHASTTWGLGGDTHAILYLPSGPPLYDEPNQPYSADRFGPLDWTASNTRIDPQFPALLMELLRAGFRDVLVFLYGDDGERGFPIAMRQLDLVHDALLNSPYGDLRPYVVVLPGWDGVFYGYTPAHIYEYGEKCRQLFLYCGLEHQTGRIPAGEGDSEWIGNGRMRAFDLLLSEFDDGKLADDTVWQIAGRLLGLSSKGGTYRRPPEQPAGDDPNPPWYLRQPTERGFIRDCAFEFYEYSFVRRRALPADVSRSRDYFKQVGYTCGG